VSCTFYQLWSYDVAVAESNTGIFMESRRNIRNCALYGNFSFYFSLLIFRLFFGRKKIFFHFRWFYFFGRKQKNHFRSSSTYYNIRRLYFTGCTHYALVSINIRLWNCSLPQTWFLFTKITRKCMMFRPLTEKRNK